MMYLRKKLIRNKSYYYVVEGERDKEKLKQIEKIKNHEWVKVIERQ